MEQKSFSVPKSYGESVEKAFGIELETYEGMKIPYAIDDASKQVTINEKFIAKYNV